MSEQNQNLASNHSKKYTYRSEPKQISFRVCRLESQGTKHVSANFCPITPNALKCILRRSASCLYNYTKNEFERLVTQFKPFKTDPSFSYTKKIE